MKKDLQYNYTPLTEPVPLTEQKWPEGTMPLVHTNTMTYNHESYIRDCIEGILMQRTTFPVRVLIHDDASTDNTSKIVREYERKYPWLIKAYYQKENSHRSPNKRKMRAPFAKWKIGKYHATCEGDDYWTDPLKLQKQLEFMEMNPDCTMVCTGVEIQKLGVQNMREKKIYSYFKENQRISIEEYLTTPYFMATATLLYSRSILFDEPEPWMRKSFAGDFVLRYRALAKGSIGVLPDVTAVYRKGVTNSWSKRKLTKSIIIKEFSDNLRGLNYIDRKAGVSRHARLTKIKQLRKNAYLKTANMIGGIKGLCFILANFKALGFHHSGSYLKGLFIINGLKRLFR